MIEKVQVHENEIFSYLPQYEMFLYFPQSEEICQKISEPRPKIVRKIFHVYKFYEEEDKLIDTLKSVIKNYIDKTSKVNKSKDYEMLNVIHQNREDMLRYLNYNDYDPHQALNMLKNLSNLLDKYKINVHIEFTEKIKFFLNYGFIYCLGRDKRYRPILVIDFRKYDSILIKQIENKDIIEFFLYYINFVIEKMMLPGQIEQFNVIIQIDCMDSSNFLNNFKDIIFTIQMYFPSRLNNLYILTFKNTIESSFSLIENYLLLYNKARMIIVNKKKYKSLFKEISQEMLVDLLGPILKKNQSFSSNDSNEKESIRNNLNSKTKSRKNVCFPPVLNNNIIFDKEEEKIGLHMEVEDYLKFINENKGFYYFDNNLFSNSNTINTNTMSNKEFPIEKSGNILSVQEVNKQKDHLHSRNQSGIIRLKINNSECDNPMELTKEPLRNHDDNIPKTCSGNKYQKDDIVKENLTDGIQFITRTKSSNRINHVPKNSLSEREHHYRRNSITHGSWKKNLTIKIYDNMDSTQNSNNKFFNQQFENLSTSQKREKNHSNLVIENQGRGDSCCKNLNNCSIF